MTESHENESEETIPMSDDDSDGEDIIAAIDQSKRDEKIRGREDVVDKSDNDENGDEEDEDNEDEDNEDEDNEDEDSDDDNDEYNQIDNEEEEEEEMTESDISSLLNLASEHDRVDIIKEILHSHPSFLNGCSEEEPTPLHIAVANHCVQSTNCLLRMGADPSIILKHTTNPKYLKYCHKTAYDLSQKNPEEKAIQLHQAFFMETVRAMNAGEISRVKQMLESGMNGEGLLDWVPEEDEGVEKELFGVLKKFGIVTEHPPPESDAPDNVEDNATPSQPEPPSQPETTPSPSTQILSQKLEESQHLFTQLSSSIEDLFQEIKISQSLLLSGSSALVNHVKSMKAQRAQKEVEYEQYRHMLEVLQAQLAEEDEVEPVEEVEEERSEEELTKSLEASEAKIRKMRATLMDLTEENTRIAEEVNNLGLSGAVRFACKLRDEVKAMEYEIQLVKDGVAMCKKLLGRRRGEVVVDEVEDEDEDEELIRMIVVENGGGSHDDEEEEEDDDEEEEDEEEEEEESNASSSMFTGKSNAIILSQSGITLDFWELFRRIMGRIGSVSKKEFGDRSSSVMII